MLGVGSEVECLAGVTLACGLVVDRGGFFRVRAVSLADGHLAESAEFDGACSVVAVLDQPGSFLVDQVVVDDVLDGTFAQLTGSKKRAVPALHGLGEVVLAVLVVVQPDVGKVAVDGGAALLGRLRRSGQQFSGCGVALASPIESASHGGLEDDSAVLGEGDVSVDPKHVVVCRNLRLDRGLAALSSKGVEEVRRDILVAVSSV